MNQTLIALLIFVAMYNIGFVRSFGHLDDMVVTDQNMTKRCPKGQHFVYFALYHFSVYNS